METPSKTQNVESTNDLTFTSDRLKSLKRFFTSQNGPTLAPDRSLSALTPVDYGSQIIDVHSKNEDPFGLDFIVLAHLQNSNGHE